jgi:hypothetical protein
MMMVYLQINLGVAMSWLLYRLIPWPKTAYRTVKIYAQALLALGLLTPLALNLMPDHSFPQLRHRSAAWQGVDEGEKIPSLASSSAQALRATGAALISLPQHTPTLPWECALLVANLIAILRWARDWYHLRALLRAASPLHSLGRVRLLVSDSASIPFSVWLFPNSYVVLPTSLIAFPKHLRVALRHEIEHHRSRDTHWTQLLELLLCALPLNPAIYAWKRSLSQLQELACDETLISQMRIPAQDYGRCLLKVAEMALETRGLYAGTTCMILGPQHSRHSFLKRRIQMFAQHERGTRNRAIVLALGTASSLLLFALAFAAQAAWRFGTPAYPGQPQVDSAIQAVAESALRSSLTSLQAGGGLVVVSDANTGRLLASVSINQGFDPNATGNWALSYPLPPASALKSVLVATAMNQNLTTLNELHGCEDGSYIYGSQTIKDAEPYAQLSTADTLVHSSNICMTKINALLGPQGLEQGLRTFGFGADGSAARFPSARPGIIPAAQSASPEDYIGSMAQGSFRQQEFFVTPLEMVAAYGAIANGGKLMLPLSGPDQSPKLVRQVLTPEVAAKVRTTLRRVVSEGTGQRINSSLYTLAGKTSSFVTDDQKHIGGFIGYAPADAPRLVIYVVIFDPKGKNTSGSSSAAPVFREVAERSLTHLGL